MASILALFCTFAIFSGINAQDPNEKDVKFYFYPNETDAAVRKELKLEAPDSLKDPFLLKDSILKVIVHGSAGDCLKEDFPLQAVTGYLENKAGKKGSYNVICLDYGPLAAPFNGKTPMGPQASLRYIGKVVSTKTSKLLQELKKSGIISSLSQVHVIGHSLGAHVSGTIGFKTQMDSCWMGKIGRITGLDPGTTVGFDELDLDIQLDSSDADFVDVVHTNAGQIGLKGKFGQVDFYPDGGEHQSKCKEESLLERFTRIGFCSHLIVGRYWKESIIGEDQIACKAENYEDFKQKQKKNICDQPAVFGERVSNMTHGRYYLDIKVAGITDAIRT